MIQQPISVSEMSVEELERVELKLWRERDYATSLLNRCNQELQIITSELANREKLSQQQVISNKQE